jgi:hypothetical protein
MKKREFDLKRGREMWRVEAALFSSGRCRESLVTDKMKMVTGVVMHRYFPLEN